MGKTRLAAEIAGEAHREDAAVFYAAGTGPPEAALAAIARTREPRRPALVVVDDADRAPAVVRAALRDLAPALHRLPVLVLATGQETAALARLEPDEALVLEPLDAGSVRAIAACYAPVGAERGARRDVAGHEPRDRTPGSRGRRGVGARRGHTRRRRGGRARGGRPRRGPRARGGARRQGRRAAVGSRARRPGPRRRRRRGRAGGLPVQGPGAVRRRGRRVLLRTRAAGRRAGRAPGRRTAARGRRTVGERQVVGAAGRAVARPRGRRPAGERRLDAGADPAGRAAAARAWPRNPPARSRMAPCPRGRPVRGAVHRLPGRDRAGRVRRRARACRAR